MNETLHRTESVCPVCLARLPAAYVAREGGVFLEKTCPRHGAFAAPVWQDAAGFLAWQRENPAQPPQNPANPVAEGCPYDCGLCAAHRQASCCVLLEVTARCNLGCPVCYAAASETAPADPDLPTIAAWYDMLLAHGGPFNIQLSGGEPTMRDDLPEIIALGRGKGFTFFQLNTNGLRLARDENYLTALVAAGLSTVFLQFDGVSDEPYMALRGRALLAEKKRAIEHCAKAGVGVVLVPTVQRGVNDGQLGAIVEYAAGLLPWVRGVHFQPISFFGRYGEDFTNEQRMTVPALLAALEQQTGGRVRAAHFLPAGAEHAMCSFHADYAVEGATWTLQESAGNAGCCAPAAESCCAPAATSNAARDAVARKWSAPAALPKIGWEGDERYNLDSLDDFLQKKNTRTLALSGMAFQDAWTLDLQRLAKCHVHVISPVGQLVPFCAWNLTAADGRALHRPQSP